MVSQGSLKGKKAVSVWKQPLKAEFTGLFKNLAKALAETTTLQWQKVVPSLAEAAASVGFRKDPQQLAWLLVRRALAAAVVQLVGQTPQLLRTGKIGPEAQLHDELDAALQGSEFHLPRDFFRNPHKIEVLTALQAHLENWLLGLQLPEPRAASIAARLPGLFVYCLVDEWRQNREQYALLVSEIETPFDPAIELEEAWSHYGAWLETQTQESVFGESFGLHQIFIPLRSYYEKSPAHSTNLEEQPPGEKEEIIKVVGWLEAHLVKWVGCMDKRDAFRFLAGGPGSGKSSFAKMFAARLVRERMVRVIYIPLQRLALKGDLSTSLADFLRRSGLGLGTPLDVDSGPDKLLLIFDGLDELAMLNKVAEDMADKFLREIRTGLADANAQCGRVLALITSREVTLQRQLGALVKEGTVLHLISYHEPGNAEERKKRGFDDPSGLLEQDQRDEWWRKYGELTAKNYSSLPEELRSLRSDANTEDKLAEITSQPLLNYLVALSYEGGDIDFTKEVNRNTIYADLLGKVFRRGWADEQHPAIGKLSERDFLRVLEEIALAIWHGSGRTTSVRGIEQHCADSGLKPLLEIFQEGVQAGVTRLLTAFYFREAGALGDDRVFEFTHKSFGEYLTARRIVSSLERITRYLIIKREHFDEGWDEVTALTKFTELCGPTPFDKHLVPFLEDEVALRKLDDRKKMHDELTKLLNYVLRQEIPVDRLNPRPAFREEVRVARNAKEALLLCLIVLSFRSEVRTQPSWPTETSQQRLLYELYSERHEFTRSVFLCLDLGAARFSDPLDGADLRRVAFRNANLDNLSFVRSMLISAQFSECHGINVEFSRTFLSQVVFEGVQFYNSRFNFANVTKARIAVADFGGCEFLRANLKWIAVSDVKFRGCRFHQTDFEGAHFENTIFHECEFNDANFKDASFEGVKMEFCSGVPQHVLNLVKAVL